MARTRKPKCLTLEQQVIDRLDARARASTLPSGKSRSGQVAVCLDEAEANARTLRAQLVGDVGAIKGSVEVLLERMRHPDDQRHLRLIQRAVERLIRGIEKPSGNL